MFRPGEPQEADCGSRVRNLDRRYPWGSLKGGAVVTGFRCEFCVFQGMEIGVARDTAARGTNLPGGDRRPDWP